MKKIYTILIGVLCIVLIFPTLGVKAVTDEQINAIVQILCPDDYDNWYSGSGTIIDSKGIILTNKHVVTDQFGEIINTCFIGFIESISQEPNFGTEGSYNLAEVKYYTSTDDMDVAILYLDNPSNKQYPYVNIWNGDSSSLKLGDRIEAIGFPSIGGVTITYTSGDFSGFGSKSNGTENYLKSTAILEHGNSGGAAYDSTGNFVGIPTMVVTGSLNSISYLLSVDSIKNWLTSFLGSTYKEQVTQNESSVTEPALDIQEDITPPQYKQYEVTLLQFNQEEQLKNRSSVRNNVVIYKFSKVSFGWDQDCTYETSQVQRDVCIMDDTSLIAGYYYYLGDNPSAIPKNDGQYISANEMLKDTYFDLPYAVKLPFIFDAQLGRNYFILQAKDANNNVSNVIVNIEYIYEPDRFKDIKSFDIMNPQKNLIGNVRYPLAGEIQGCTPGSFCADNRELDYTNRRIYTNQDSIYLYPKYGYSIDGLVYYISYGDDTSWHDRTREGAIAVNNYLKVDNLLDKKVTNIFIKPNKNSINEFLGKHFVLSIEYAEDLKNIITVPESGAHLIYTPIDGELANRLKGSIVLQVESAGEAYYIYPNDQRRYYLGRPADAFEIMRRLGLGATHEFITSHITYPDHVLGKILLDVEQDGEAYYIYPKDKKAYYLGRPSDAFEIMRNLGLGITNTDLHKISEGNI